MWCVGQQARLMAASFMHALLLTLTLLWASCRAAGQSWWWLNPPHSHEEINTGHEKSPLQCPSLQRVDSMQPDIAAQPPSAVSIGRVRKRRSDHWRSVICKSCRVGSVICHRRALRAWAICMEAPKSLAGPAAVPESGWVRAGCGWVRSRRLQIVAKFGRCRSALATRQRALVNGRRRAMNDDDDDGEGVTLSCLVLPSTVTGRATHLGLSYTHHPLSSITFFSSSFFPPAGSTVDDCYETLS